MKRLLFLSIFAILSITLLTSCATYSHSKDNKCVVVIRNKECPRCHGKGMVIVPNSPRITVYNYNSRGHYVPYHSTPRRFIKKKCRKCDGTGRINIRREYER